MFDPRGDDIESNNSADRSRDQMSRKILDEASLFVASVVDLLTKKSTEDSLRVVEVLRRRGVITAREFTEAVDSMPGSSFSSELLWAYQYLAKRVVDLDFAEGLPALVSVAHKALMDSPAWDEREQRRLFVVLDKVLDARVASDELADRLTAAMSVAEHAKLKDIARNAPQDRKGYWEALELMCAVYPDTLSLDTVFCAVDRIGARRLSRVEREGAHRCVCAVAADDFQHAFEYVAHAVQHPERSKNSSLVKTVIQGLAFHTDRVISELAHYLTSSDVAYRDLVCRICLAAAHDHEVLLATDQRDALRMRLFALANPDPARNHLGRSVDVALGALALMSNIQEDIELVGRNVRERLHHGEVLPSELVHAYAEGLARIVGEGGIVGLKPLSWKRVSSLSSNPPLMHGRAAGARRVVAPDTESVFENLAMELTSIQGFEDVVEVCRQHERFLDPRALKPRDNDATSLFYDLKDAALFSEHYANLCERGPLEFAAVLFPEFLSAVDRARKSEKDDVIEAVGVNALRSAAGLTSILINNREAGGLVTARMSAADWDLLAGLHQEVRHDFPSVYPDLGLATFALRSTIESEKSWQKELIRWWHGVDDAVRNSMDPNALAFVSVAAERSCPGSALSLIQKLSLAVDDAKTFQDVAVGLLVHPTYSAQRITSFVSSEKGDTLARGFLLSQLMKQHLSDTQRTFIVGVAKRSLDELGVLSLDAVSTVGALSRSQEDASMLLGSSPALGVSDSVHMVSCARAAAQILRNIQRAV